MEIVVATVMLAVWGGLLYWIYARAGERNRNPITWLVLGILLSPVLTLIIQQAVGDSSANAAAASRDWR